MWAFSWLPVLYWWPIFVCTDLVGCSSSVLLSHTSLVVWRLRFLPLPFRFPMHFSLWLLQFGQWLQFLLLYIRLVGMVSDYILLRGWGPMTAPQSKSPNFGGKFPNWDCARRRHQDYLNHLSWRDIEVLYNEEIFETALPAMPHIPTTNSTRK